MTVHETNERIGRALAVLTGGLQPFVAARMEARHGRNWRAAASTTRGGGPNGPLDAYALLKTMLDNWQEVFGRDLPRNARNHVSFALDGRNEWAHPKGPMSAVEALRTLDSIAEVLKAAGAKSAAAQARTLHEEQIRAAGPAVVPSPAPQAQADLIQPATSQQLKPWREVAVPHVDVLESRFKQAEFAADLTAVDLGRASPEYQVAEEFFKITFLTEGMKKVLSLAAERLSGGDGGEPVIGLQTAFGGGKTHTMLAILHMARSLDPRALAGLGDLLSESLVRGWQKAQRYTLVGTGLGANQRLSRDDEPVLFTPWGVMAWRLADKLGLELLEEAEATRSAPGSERLVTLLEAAAPCLILFDELVAYARVLDNRAFEAFLNFIQSLTEAANMVPGALVVGSLIESDSEAGGQRGVEARRRLEKIFGRVQSAWFPAQGPEQYEIIRRRLFQELDATGLRDRDATVKAFYDLYRANRGEFPSEVTEAQYRDTLSRAYPIHPELFRIFSEVWVGAANEKFQQTRGMLRLMANVVYALWRADDPNPLILPGSLPLADPRVRGGVLEPLNPQYPAILEAEVEGSAARPQVVEAQRRGFGAVKAMTRAARAVFMATAPHAGAPNSGVTGPRLRLGCVQPGDQINIFGDALRELAESSAYLHRDGERYWFGTVPTLNQLASEMARDFDAASVDAMINRLLDREKRPPGKFARVHATGGDDPTGVDDTPSLALVILDARFPHAGRSVVETPAMKTAAEVMERRGSAQRHFRNELLFAAPDESRLADGRLAVRKLMAWEAIVSRAAKELQLPPARKAEAEAREEDAGHAARRAIRSAWSHLIIPSKADETLTRPSRGYELHAAPIQNSSGEKSVAEAAYDKGVRDGAITEKLGAPILNMQLDRLIADQPHITVRDLAEWSAKYVHMKRLRDDSVLARAVEELVASSDTTYVWANGVDAATDRYSGLCFGRVVSVDLRGSGLLVRRDVAEQQMIVTVSPKGNPPSSEPGPGDEPSVLDPEGPTSEPPQRKHRFFGVVTVDAARPGPQVGQIAQVILAELARARDAKVTVKLDIEADSAAGFPDDVVSVVSANAQALKFEQNGFE
jgi:hypothetical protein